MVVHGAPGPAVVLPPLTQPASAQHHVGKVVWMDLVTPDIEGAKRFYGALFGWTFSAVPGDSNYALALLDGAPLAGLFQKSARTGSILRVADAAETASKAVTLGGRVLVEPRIDRHGGRLAVLADPGGAPFGVMEWSDTDGKQEPQ